jgi:hypothetical protein
LFGSEQILDNSISLGLNSRRGHELDRNFRISGRENNIEDGGEPRFIPVMAPFPNGTANRGIAVSFHRGPPNLKLSARRGVARYDLARRFRQGGDVGDLGGFAGFKAPSAGSSHGKANSGRENSRL